MIKETPLYKNSQILMLENEEGLIGFKLSGKARNSGISYRKHNGNLPSYVYSCPYAFHGLPRIRRNKNNHRTMCYPKFIQNSAENYIFGELRNRYTEGIPSEVLGLARRKFSSKNKRKYFAQRDRALKEVNYAIAKCLKHAAYPNAIRITRRFPYELRKDIYYLAAYNDRAAQLFESFPILACFIFNPNGAFDDWASGNRVELIQKVYNGHKLKEIASEVGIPMCMKKIKPQHVYHASGLVFFFKNNPRLLHDFMPDKTMQMGRWLHAIRQTGGYWRGGMSVSDPEAAWWFAKNIPVELKKREIFGELSGISDWLRMAEAGNHYGITFSKNISLAAAKERSKQWHELHNIRQREIYERDRMRHENRLKEERKNPYPDPWLPKDIVDDFSIEPITNYADLSEEGVHMQHCVSSYDSDIRNKTSYIYSVKKNNKRIATLELRQSDNSLSLLKYKIAQLRGKCNSDPKPETKKAVIEWIKKHTNHKVEKISGEISLCQL